MFVPRGTSSSPFTPFVSRAGLPPHMPTRGGGRSAPLPRATDIVSLRENGGYSPFPIAFSLTTLTSLTSLTTFSTFNSQLSTKKKAAGAQQMIDRKE
jgi:hypothetical protein